MRCGTQECNAVKAHNRVDIVSSSFVLSGLWLASLKSIVHVSTQESDMISLTLTSCRIVSVCRRQESDMISYLYLVLYLI